MVITNCIINYYKLKHTIIMNKEQTKAFILYCNLTFGHENVSVNECLACIDEDARDLGLTRIQYLDYIVYNNRLPD